MCGIMGIVAQNAVNQDIFDALTFIQHRGQDAAGIVTCNLERLYLRKSNGLICEVVKTRHMQYLLGNMGIGHVRYPTAGTASEAESQPFYVNSPYGITLAHNGNLTNQKELQQILTQTYKRHLNTSSDSEVLLNVFANELQKSAKTELIVDDIFQAVTALNQICRGGYAAVAMIAGYGIVAFRDPYGIRPIVYGKRETEQGVDHMVASESVALDCLGFTDIHDILPGEAIFIDTKGKLHRKQCTKPATYSPCIFELVYLARPDSIIDKISVYKVRLRMGELLAEKIRREWPELDIDVVMPIPDTSRTAASSLAHSLGAKYREGFVKNRYIARTFIMPGQKMRKESVRLKLNTIPLEFRNKNVLLVDDSIVRGTTSKEIVKMARQAGAKKVYFASASPPVRFPNVYGIDIPVAKELIAHKNNNEQICEAIGADRLIFQDLQALVTAAREGNPEITRFEDSVFSGNYITGDINEDYLNHLEKIRSDSAKKSRLSNHHLRVDLPNI